MADESVHNYYEKLVFEQIGSVLGNSREAHDSNFVADVACVALNRLPTRYIRYDIDLAFYLSSDERLKIDKEVKEAVDYGVSFVRGHARRDSGAYVA